MSEELSKLDRAMQISLVVANLLVLVYLGIYAWACPSGPLVAAVVFEIGVFASLAAFRVWKTSTKKDGETEQVLSSLQEKFRILAHVRRTYCISVLTVATVACSYMFIDYRSLGSGC